MKIMSVAPHPMTFVSADGQESVTIPPRVIVGVADGFISKSNIPQYLKIVGTTQAPSSSSTASDPKQGVAKSNTDKSKES